MNFQLVTEKLKTFFISMITTDKKYVRIIGTSSGVAQSKLV